MIIPPGKLAKGRETGGSHPHLKFFVLVQLWRRVLFRVTMGPPFDPIRGNGNILGFIFGIAVQVFFASPGNPFFGQFVSLVVEAVPHGGEVSESVIKQRIGNESTRIIRLLSRVVDS